MSDRPRVDLSGLVKAYDIRGIVPDQLDEGLARLFGTAFVETDRRGRDRDRARHAPEFPGAGTRLRGGRGRVPRRREQMPRTQARYSHEPPTCTYAMLPHHFSSNWAAKKRVG